MAQGRYSMDFLKSKEAREGRIARQPKPAYVVWVEFGDGFVELDAESNKHAVTLAKSWLDTVEGVVAVSVQEVLHSGKTACRFVFSPEYKEEWEDKHSS